MLFLQHITLYTTTRISVCFQQCLTISVWCVHQVLSAATVIAKHTSALCNACRVASAQTHNPVAKRHFVQSAKDVANSTASLVKEIKGQYSNFNFNVVIY